MPQASKAASAIHQLMEELNSDYHSQIVGLFGKYRALPPKRASLITFLACTGRSEQWQHAAAAQGEIWQKHPVRYVCPCFVCVAHTFVSSGIGVGKTSHCSNDIDIN